jgi:hypothetical protein
MKIVFKKDALEIDSKRKSPSSGYTREEMNWRENISKMLKDGLEHEVETTYLFDNSFNCKHPDGQKSEKFTLSIHVPDYMVESVIDDARTGKSKCSYCGKIHNTPENKKGSVCPSCGHENTLVKLIKG